MSKNSKQSDIRFEKIEDHFQFSLLVVIFPLFFILILWIVFLLEKIIDINLVEYGVYPRTFVGLRGIFFSTFLHEDMRHLFNNSTALMFLLPSICYFYRKESLQIIFFGIILTGIMIWSIGRSSYHIGASGLIYVLISYIFLKGIKTKYYRLMALSLVIVFLYGGLVWYIFPNVDDKISWEGHLSGFLIGIVLSFFYKTKDYSVFYKYDWEKPDFNPHLDAFMKHFDEKGNFIKFPEQTTTGDKEVIYFSKKEENSDND